MPFRFYFCLRSLFGIISSVFLTNLKCNGEGDHTRYSMHWTLWEWGLNFGLSSLLLSRVRRPEFSLHGRNDTQYEVAQRNTSAPQALATNISYQLRTSPITTTATTAHSREKCQNKASIIENPQ